MAKRLKKKTVAPRAATINSAREALTTAKSYGTSHKRMLTQRQMLLLSDLCVESVYKLNLIRKILGR